MAIIRSLGPSSSVGAANSLRRAAVPLFAVSVVCLVLCVALVDFDVKAPLQPARPVLESVGMGSVLAAKQDVEAREKTYVELQGEAHNAQLSLDKATERKVKLTNALDDLDRAIDKQSAKMSKDAATAEQAGDNANDLINEAHDHEHKASSDKRHAQTAKRREAREEVSLGVFTKQSVQLSKKAAAELKDAMRRQEKAAKLRSIARKHKEAAAALKQQIRDVLRGQAASLSSAIDRSQRAVLQATEAAKGQQKKWAELTARAGKHQHAATLAQQQADQAALAAEGADREAARLADKVSVELSTAENSKHKLARLLASAANPQGATTLRTAVPTPLAAKTLNSKDVSLGPNSAAPRHASPEMEEAARKIRALEREKRAAQAAADKERQMEKKLEKEMQQQKIAREKREAAGASKRPAPRADEDNFSAAMNYLNNRHMDASSGLDDQGRDAVGQEVPEGRRAFVGVKGRSPHLDSIATANLRQYQEDESELDQANYDDSASDATRNPF